MKSTVPSTRGFSNAKKTNMKELTQDNFSQEVLESADPVLVDFTASWCGPCKMLAPVLDELETENQGVKFVKVDVDEQSALAQQYSVMSMPTLLFFKEGKVMEQMIGVQPKESIQRSLENLK